MTQTDNNQAPNNKAAFIWALADLLRGDFKQSQYGRIILPFALLRRLEGVLEETKETVLAKYQEALKIVASTICNNLEFGYRRLTLERPLHLSYQFSDERIDELRFAPRPLNAVMKWIYSEYGNIAWRCCCDSIDFKNYGVLSIVRSSNVNL